MHIPIPVLLWLDLEQGQWMYNPIHPKYIYLEVLLKWAKHA